MAGRKGQSVPAQDYVPADTPNPYREEPIRFSANSLWPGRPTLAASSICHAWNDMPVTTRATKALLLPCGPGRAQNKFNTDISNCGSELQG
ncbi:hypothetical protein VCV18_003737 [Metarhizium anisopliae]